MSENKKKSRLQLNRRSFLKGIAATGAISAIVVSHPTSASQSTSIRMAITESFMLRERFAEL